MKGKAKVSEIPLYSNCESVFTISLDRKQRKHTNVPKAGMPSSLHPSIIPAFPPLFDVMNTTSGPHDVYTSLINFITSGRFPRSFESQSVYCVAGRLTPISVEIVGPNVFSWSEPIQMRYQSGLCRQLESAAPSPVPVQTRIPRLYILVVFETPANLSWRVQRWVGGLSTRDWVKSPWAPQMRQCDSELVPSLFR